MSDQVIVLQELIHLHPLFIQQVEIMEVKTRETSMYVVSWIVPLKSTQAISQWKDNISSGRCD